jgi:methylmalonyl-CoA mutase N-terminal domain/subunit
MHDTAADELLTGSGVPVRPLYTPEDIEDFDHERDLGTPGSAPYTRGVRRSMYRDRAWTVRQLAGFATPEDTNQRLRSLLANGASGVNTVFDFPTNRGYDSDDPFAEGDVGQGGVAVDSVDDMLALYDGVPMDEVSVSIVISHPVAAGAVFAMYLVAAERRGYNWSELAGTLQNDFMMETVVLTAPCVLRPEFAFRLSMDVVEFCVRQVPRWNPVSFTGYNYREAGADAVQEAALVVAHAVAAARELVRRGLPVDSFAHRLTSFLTADNDFFEEIAKYRAVRRVYQREFSQRFAPDDPRSSMLRFHVQTAGSALTAQQPLNNITRAAYHGLAAVLGGAQSLHISAYDEALSIPSEAAALTALRTQQLLQLETGVTATADPLGGSYFVESLTSELDRRITDTVAEIDELGGLVAAVEKGWVHDILLDNAYRREVEVCSGERKVVGVNCHTEQTRLRISPFRVPDALERQRDKLTCIRAGREQSAVDAALAALKAVVASGANTMPALVDAVREGATLGECCAVFRAAHGGWIQPLL